MDYEDCLLHDRVEVMDPSIPRPARIPHAEKDSFIRYLNERNEWVPAGWKFTRFIPRYTVPQREEVQHEYGPPLFKELRESVRSIDNCEQSSQSMQATHKQTGSLRHFAMVHDLDPEDPSTVDKWYAQSARPHEVVDNSHIGLRAHYKRMDPRTEKELPGNEFVVSKTAYLKWFKEHPASVKSAWDSRKEPSFYMKTFGYHETEPCMVSGSDTFMNVPLGKFQVEKVNPHREDSEIQYLGGDLSKMSKRQKIWWAAETYRHNLKRDGMRRFSNKLYIPICKHYGVSEKTLRQEVRKAEPLQARGSFEGVAAGAPEPSEKGSGFVGISGDFDKKFSPKKLARWTVPWLIG